jgi:hypothetical protein
MAIIGFTAKLELDPGTGSYATIDECTMITLPAFETTSIETSHLNLITPDRTYTPGLTDNGTLSFECNYSKATYNTLHSIKGKLKVTSQIPPTGNNINWRITSPDEDGAGAGTAQTFTFNGFLTKLETAFETEAVVKIKGEVKVNGAITVGDAS